MQNTSNGYRHLILTVFPAIYCFQWTFEAWVRRTKLPHIIAERLQREDLVTLKLLQMLLTKGELTELGLSIGNRMILKEALESLEKKVILWTFHIATVFCTID